MIRLEFTLEQLQTIDRILQDAPYRVAAPLIADINRQLQAQQQGNGQIIVPPPEARAQ
ncbi:MAG: hypothetical protein HRJ53_24535 [Acidobacteria bacterium Pan2503]|uniref:Uncharacterized protein n=1 Tax=Candidatus Acidiferrum panamense TaxID=2741543 RepID=A0A7V8NVT3_9BACT|nr:hypothetical protein [Candidatus Acidoferrum panamensis]